MYTAWIREFVDNHILSMYHTSERDLTANALTRRVAATEQQWAVDDIRGFRYHRTSTSNVVPNPIRRSDHINLWPEITCSAIEE